ncbi:MAG: RNA-binding domain-containing protein [Candidatus Methanoperedens sp.]
MNAKVAVFAPVYPTEVQEKVEKAILNFFPFTLELQDDVIPGLYGEGNIENLRKLHSCLREERILDTARRIFLNGIQGNTTRFRLKKQVAYIGKLNFPGGVENLGSIDVEISADNEDDLLAIIDWLAPQTVDGEPVIEIEL